MLRRAGGTVGLVNTTLSRDSELEQAYLVENAILVNQYVLYMVMICSRGSRKAWFKKSKKVVPGL